MSESNKKNEDTRLTKKGRSGSRQLLLQTLYQYQLNGDGFAVLFSQSKQTKEFARIDQAHFKCLLQEILKDLDSSYIEKQNYTIRTRKYRYILYKDGSEEFYNHDNDPKEWNNLSSDKNYQKLKKKMRKQLLEKLKT